MSQTRDSTTETDAIEDGPDETEIEEIEEIDEKEGGEYLSKRSREWCEFITPETIRQCRVKNGLTQDEFGARAGLHGRTISKYEQGNQPSLDVYSDLQSVFETFGFTPDVNLKTDGEKRADDNDQSDQMNHTTHSEHSERIERSDQPRRPEIDKPSQPDQIEVLADRTRVKKEVVGVVIETIIDSLDSNYGDTTKVESTDVIDYADDISPTPHKIIRVLGALSEDKSSDFDFPFSVQTRRDPSKYKKGKWEVSEE